MRDLPLSALPPAAALRSPRPLRAVASPPGVLALALLSLLALLHAVPTLPIGPMYWDLFIYFDAANRIFDGQVPSADFFAPVGPLGYWLFAGALRLFPHAQPLLLVDWSLLAVSAPLMALVVADVGARARGLAFALLLPFLLFSALPFNVEAFSSYPGVDGFGIYNRQGARLLYVLASALVFCEAPRRQGLAVAGTMLALFLLKITGFLAGGVLCLLALLAGRVRVSTAFCVALASVCGLATLEAATGAVLPYLAAIRTLVAMNEGELLGRFLQAASVHFGVFLPCVALAAVLLVVAKPPLLPEARAARHRLSLAAVNAVFDHPAIWVGGASFAALFFETQNTGGQAFISIWPALLIAWQKGASLAGGRRALVLGLVAAAALPTAATVTERAGRAFIGALRYERLASTNLGPLGAVTQRDEFLRRAELMLGIYAANPGFYERFAARGELPNPTLFADPDYQLAFLKTLDEAVEAVTLYEMANGVRFETVLNIGFVNPLPFLLDRHAPRFVSIGADPSRTVPAPDAKVADAIRATDLLLYAKCPETAANRDLLTLYEPFLAGHKRIALGRCWEGFVREGLAR